MASAFLYDSVSFDSLPGWSEDNHDAALQVFRKTCGDARSTSFAHKSEWSSVCKAARASVPSAKDFFEGQFTPVQISDGRPALFTGYFEPELAGSRVRKGRYQHPVYRLPKEASRGDPWLTRREIINGALNGRGLEIAWLDDPVDVFFLHIQGSGRVRLEDGTILRLGFAGRNGHTYRSVGLKMVEMGLIERHQASAAVIRNYVAENPVSGMELLNHNGSFVFFREIETLEKNEGPVGAMGRSLTGLRSVAIDPKIVPLGAPVWVDVAGAAPLRRLMIAQDTGSAIKGAQRADLFIGTGEAAGLVAGRVNHTGQLLVLLPNALAERLLDEAEPHLAQMETSDVTDEAQEIE